MFEIVAHRGAPCLESGDRLTSSASFAPENTLPAFLRALNLGADAVELDVRLTADWVPVVYHYFYLDENTSFTGAIYQYTWEELRQAQLVRPGRPNNASVSIPSLEEVLAALAGRIGLEIEIKGPEEACVEIIASTLKNFPQALKMIEITSYEIALLERFQRLMPGLPVDLLIPLSEPWMKADVLGYTALQLGKLAGARAVHLHASQLTLGTMDFIRQGGCDVHAWGINDRQALKTASELQITRICTDNLELALQFRLEQSIYERMDQSTL